MDNQETERKRLRIGVWPTLILVLAVVGFIVFDELSTQKAAIGKPAPNFTLVDTSGKSVSLTDYRDQVVMLNFWASWCGPCREETPALQSFAARYGHKVALLGINYKEALDKINPFIQEFGITYPVLRDTDGKIAERYKMKALPESWFIDEAGIARIYSIGTMTFEDMRDAYQSTTGLSIDGDRQPGDATRAYRFFGRSGLALRDGDQAWKGSENGAVWAKDTVEATPGLMDPVRTVAWAGRTALAWVEGKGLYRSIDDGRNWRLIEQTTFAKELLEVALAISDGGNRAWAGSMQGLFVSNDAGKTWKALPFNRAVNGIAVHPAQSGRLFIATAQGIWNSNNGGATTAILAGSPARRFDDVAVVRMGVESAILAVAPNGDVYRTNGAGQWTLLNPDKS